MRPRTEIEQDGKVKADLMIEVLLDLRDLLQKKEIVKRHYKKRKAPAKK